MTEELNQLGRQADRIDSLVAGLAMALPPQLHFDQLKAILPGISAEIKQFVVAQSGENPWELQP